MPEKHSATNPRAVADLVGVTKSSVSAVLSGTPISVAIPQCTKDRMFEPLSNFIMVREPMEIGVWESARAMKQREEPRWNG